MFNILIYRAFIDSSKLLFPVFHLSLLHKRLQVNRLVLFYFSQHIEAMSSTDATINSSFLEKPSFVFDIKKMNVRGKSFIKRTRKGNIAKVTKEHYLRDDIPCLSPLCTTCPHKEVKLLSNSAEFYLIPDTNIVLHQLDLLESDVVTDVILLQTVLQETRNRNMSVYERLKKLLNDQSRSFVSFSNEHHKETFIERQKDETSNDYNDRSIRVAARWYTTHLNRRKRVVLLTNDKNNAKGARGEGVEALSVEEFVTLYESRHPHIRELVAANTADSSEEQEDDRKRKFLYDEYWNTQQIQNALNANRVVEGVFHANSYNCMEGKVLYSGKSQQQSAKTILVSGIKNINRAIDGDVVFVELLPEEMWCTPSTEVKEDIEEAIEEAETSKPPSTVIQNINVRKEVTGRVVAIKRRNWRPYCGSLQAKGSSHLTLFIPVIISILHISIICVNILLKVDKRIPKIRIHSRRVSDLTDKRIVVSIDSWERNSMFPSGHVIEELGVEGDIETETKVLLHENSIITRAFPKAVLECLPADDLQFSPDMLKNRKDLQSLCIFSIDPPGCTDIDDALSIQLDENHNYMVGVHIADVTSFISRDTALDKEAADRSTTVYLADRRIEMLPPRLSSDLCSLKENETRLAFSAFITIDHEGNVLHYDFARTIIRSRKAFTYAEAQDYLNQARKKETKECTEIELSLLRLMDIAQKLRKRRFENGALRLSSPEVRFETDQEGDEITNVSVYETHETNELVEEYMLLTNVVVAQRISKSFPSCALLRRHPIPNKEMFEPLLKIAAALSVEIDVSSNKQLSRSLEKIQEKFDEENDPFKATLFRISTTRCMTQALYFSAGEASQEEYFHYGLASTIYTHFTSPIRRYADIIVHRMLSGSIGYTSFPDSLLNSKAIQKIADHLNERHRAAQKAARDSVALHTLRLFRGEQREEEGRVFRLLTNGIVVMLPRYGLEGLVRFEKNSSATLFDEDKQLLITPKGTRLKIFDRVRVSIQLDAQVNPAGQLVIHLIE
ncbi:exoribonuclease R [Galdieria sulphuraria]|uniref:Ribosomal RNA-processing protein 44 n=1 Tax=Galdieria sulphuraria TaxID=130081 RepID=M2XWI5_GALSU|nr:exoribonuclease R [Galdieria sulphuraria]EME27978.1 exoribonuclease R [Galdieria sulphuraria]|eukprot:XP_005704498.1 exoribonuclease R [Galdieria sulphuraria]